MRIVLTCLLLLSYAFGLFSQTSIDSRLSTSSLFSQPVLHITKVENENWTENTASRSKFSSLYTAEDGKKVAYSSLSPVNYKDENGDWQAIDIRPVFHDGNWHAFQQEIPVGLGADGSFEINVKKSGLQFSKTQFINGIESEVTQRGIHDRQQVRFPNVIPGVDKLMEFRQGGIKYNYILNTPLNIENEYFEIVEKIKLPSGFSISINNRIDRKPGVDAAMEIRDGSNQICAIVKDLVCFDNAGNVHIGRYHLDASGNGEYILKLLVESSWIGHADRTYPLVIDPLVVGVTSNFGANYIPSCFFPEYSADSLLVEVPGGITVTALNVTANFYASPFTTTVMGDGRFYFSSECGQTTVFQVQGVDGMLPGTAYLENFNMSSPILCCKPQQCTPYSIWLSIHISRTSNGPNCDTNYLYYDPFSLWPYSAYAEGYTPELYGNEMNFTPNSICSNDCDVEARIFARYGVPPYEFTHPWSLDVIDWGTAVGCSPGSSNRELILNIPDCPIYCDDNDVLQVPPPIVTDACGVVAYTATPYFELGIKPTPIAYSSVDEITVCNNEIFEFDWEICLDGASVSWSGNDSIGNSISVTDSISNNGSESSIFYYISTATLDECTGLPDSIAVTVYPDASMNFTWDPDPAIVTNEVQFNDATSYNGNIPTSWSWTLEGIEFADIPDPTFSFPEPGVYEICMFSETQFDCSELHCELVEVIPAELVLPNVVSPNNDGINDYLIIQYIDQFDSSQLFVFNRWGNVVYEASNYKNDWSPKELSDGVYYYVVDIDGVKSYSSALQVKR